MGKIAMCARGRGGCCLCRELCAFAQSPKCTFHVRTVARRVHNSYCGLLGVTGHLGGALCYDPLHTSCTHCMLIILTPMSDLSCHHLLCFAFSSEPCYNFHVPTLSPSEVGTPRMPSIQIMTCTRHSLWVLPLLWSLLTQQTYISIMVVTSEHREVQHATVLHHLYKNNVFCPIPRQVVYWLL
jgi:hypothetical protein